MIEIAKCLKRGCKHYIGVSQANGTELSERNICKAFPNGIPSEIAFEHNKHTKPFKGDHGIRFEPMNQ